MPRITPGRKSITSIFTEEEYEQIKALSAKRNKSMNEVVRQFVQEGLNGTLNSQNIEFLAPLIREQVDGVMSYYMERMISLESKTCMQAGTAAYLTADAILKFVPPQQREDVATSYNQARKKAIEYMRGKVTKEDR